MKLTSLGRREFIGGMLVAGLTACAGPRQARRAVKAAPQAPAGRFFEEMTRLADDLARGGIDPRGYADRVGARLMELELDGELMEAWREKGPDFREVGRNGYRVLHTQPLGFAGGPGSAKAVLFYTPARVTNPPHEHHNLISCKRVLVGSYHVRQYERVRTVAPGLLAIRQITELPRVGFDGPYVAMTDNRLNVHWFGAGAEPVLALNMVVENALTPAATFHGATERRPPGRYFVDPTGTPAEDGLIFAPTVGPERAEELTAHPLGDFPSHLAGDPCL
jgi:hypothetical protein